MNDEGEFLAYMMTPGNIDDQKPVPKLTEKVFGKVWGDKGYISSDLFDQLMQQGVQLITKIKYEEQAHAFDRQAHATQERDH